MLYYNNVLISVVYGLDGYSQPTVSHQPIVVLLLLVPYFGGD